uniref:Formin like 1 n=1 Tax=Cyprinus carpio TaxID=7962 RepID=A0A8C2KZB6_CYPCA
MNLPPDKVKLLCQYDNEKKWELVCDQERFQVKNPPSAYIQKLKSVLEQGGGRKVQICFKRRVQESTQVLRELEISLRTNHIGWAEEFLNEENKGLDTLVDYLSFAQRAVTYDMDSSDNGSFDEKSVEDLTTNASNSPTHNSPRLGHTFTSRKALRYSRLLSQKNHLHLCIMCLRAIMNYQVCGEKDRFEKLMEYFTNEDNNIDFMVACMQFINIIVHSVENMNFRVYLQYEFTQLGLDSYLEKLNDTESERLQVQIQAYLDNVFDVGAMLEDAEAKNTIIEHLEELQEQNTQLNTRLQQCESEAVEKTSELEKQLTQSRKEVELLKVAQFAKTHTHTHTHTHLLLLLFPGCEAFMCVKSKKPIKTKYRMPLLNWQALMEEQVAGTVFTELDDESVLGELNMDVFEELFKTKAQSAPVNVGTLKVKVAHKTSSKITLLEPNRAKNLAITLRKGGMSTAQICTAIQTFNLDLLKSDFLELLERFIPSDYELRLIENYEREGRALLELSEEDRFMVAFSKIPCLPQRISTLTFMGNFSESIQLLKPVSIYVRRMHILELNIKLKSDEKKILIILAFGNYMNSEKRGSAYGFRLQSLDLLLDMKSTDRKLTLLHFIVSIIQEKYPQLQNFHTELHCLDKAALVSLDSILADVRSLEKGMDVVRKEFLQQKDSAVLTNFMSNNGSLLDSVVKDSKTAEEVYHSVVEYFGENPKSTPPSVFFPVFARFIKAYKVMKLLPSVHITSLYIILMPSMPRVPQVDLIAELKHRQMKPLVREGKDGAIEDIITGQPGVTLYRKPLP